MYTKDNSWNSFVTHMIEEGYAKNEDTLLEHMALIPAKSRKIIEKRWGLIEKVYYSSFEQLNEQMGIDNARELYFEAMRDLFNAEYAVIGMQRYNMQTISHWNEVVALGMLFAQDTTTEIATQNLGKEEETTVVKKDNSELLKRPLKEFVNFPPRLLKFFKYDCNTLGDVLRYNATTLNSLFGFGRVRAKELIIFIKSLGIEEDEGKTLCLSLANYFNLHQLLSEQKSNTQTTTENFRKEEDATVSKKDISELLKRPLREFVNISPHLLNFFFKYNCNTLEDVLRYNATTLNRLFGFGRGRAEELIIFIKSLGIEEDEGKNLCFSLANYFDLYELLSEQKSNTQDSTSDILKSPFAKFDIFSPKLRRVFDSLSFYTLEDLLNLGNKTIVHTAYFGPTLADELLNALEHIGIADNVGKEIYTSISRHFFNIK